MTAEPHTRDLVAHLTDALPPDRVSADPQTLAALARDQLRRRRAFRPPPGVPATPLAVVRPRTTDEVVTVVRVAAETGTPLVQHGGGTGLMGGALSVVPCIVLDMRAMDRVRVVSPADRTATAEAGVVLADLDAALAPHGLILGHDPWTVPIATVGGTISTNSLGYRGARYGSMGDQVLGLEVVLPSAEVLTTRAVPRSATGPRLHQLFVGAEGVFGVITAATLRVFPAPERRELLAYDFPSFAAGFAAVQAMFDRGLTPALLDYGGPPAGTARMYLGFEGLAEEVAALAARGHALAVAHGGAQLDGALAREFWEERHVSPDRLRGWRRAEAEEPLPGEPGSVVFDYLHLSLPASRVLEYIRRAGPVFARRGVAVREWGLWNQPELLSTVITRRTDTPADLAEVVAAVDEALMLAQDLGGSMEYVHGAGLRYAHLMAREHGTGLAMLQAIKQAIDPANLLNPGKLGLR
jgi:FAD/FMN-containing dehydrogenase